MRSLAPQHHRSARSARPARRSAPGHRRRGVLGALAALVATAPVVLVAGAAAAAEGSATGPAGASGRRSGAVFVQLNAASGNEIASYSRSADGRLVAAGRVSTGGLGGTAVGAPLDALASQGSLVLDGSRRVLLAVNAGSDTVTSFAVAGTGLQRRSVVPSSGEFPVSVAVHDDLAFVLNAGGHGSVSGFRIRGGALVPIPGSTRELGLDNTAVPTFITAPSQVGFTPDGHALVVATKSNNTLLTLRVSESGRISGSPTVTPSAQPVPFSFVTDPAGRVHVTNAGTGTQTSYRLGRDATLATLGTSAPTGGAALCWNVRIGRTVYGTNAGSSTISAWRIEADGTTTLTAPVAASTPAGPIDLAASPDGRFLYGQNAVAGSLSVYAVADGGGLTPVQTVPGLPVFANGGMEGIAAS